ncbi:hypothetical protein C9374_004848 [Naegleria lovaniensis]|uniref:Uncharacterized protein n=1 Tax=Naegleria lovaniensis TaxID=51637 RepID=A0AA88KNR2_NAELO|nr:uncharacterized protein C9374_004848 [Naegleria lovaniensis]KAG2382881.1 hypothetical protein C9374_004848 [Naegleria lovaniensis]
MKKSVKKVLAASRFNNCSLHNSTQVFQYLYNTTQRWRPGQNSNGIQHWYLHASRRSYHYEKSHSNKDEHDTNNKPHPDLEPEQQVPKDGFTTYISSLEIQSYQQTYFEYAQTTYLKRHPNATELQVKLFFFKWWIEFMQHSQSYAKKVREKFSPDHCDYSNRVYHLMEYAQRKAELFLEIGMFDKALEITNEVIEDQDFKGKDDSLLLLVRGYLYYLGPLHDYRKAVLDFEKLLEMDPTTFARDVSLVQSIAFFYRNLYHDSPHVEEYSDKVIHYLKLFTDLCVEKKVPINDVFCMELAFMLLNKRKDHDQALYYLSQGIVDDEAKRAPNTEECAQYMLLTNRGSLLLDHFEKPKEASLDFERAIALNPNKRFIAHFLLGMAQAQLYQVEKAISSFEKVKEILLPYAQHNLPMKVPPDTEKLFMDGINSITLPRSKIYLECLEVTNYLISKEPQNFEHYGNRAHVFNRLKLHERALEDCNKALELNERSEVAYFNRAEAFCYLKEFDKAKLNFVQAVKMNPLLKNQVLKIWPDFEKQSNS